MAVLSSDVSALTGAFMQQSASNIAYSHMIGVGSPFTANPGADALMGGAMSHGAAMGSPMLMGAMGLMGIDPLSMGVKSAWGAFQGGAGLAGSAFAGMGAAAAVGVPLAAGGYVGNQMFTGAQQQMNLNNALRSNFRQMGPMGQGFNRSDMASIGQNMRGMTHEFGPGGEITGMGELTQIASQMGQMSMKAMRSVQEFNQKFKQTVENLKTMARDLGTTLEGAMQFSQAAQSSGIFRQSDQLRFSGMARNMSVSGGVALSEVTGMANIGSQIARSVGGLGRQGAFGGMRAIGNIGTAVQIGALTEEDIFNSTGLRGAEGRQAMATNMLSNDARFLKSGRGRRLLAAMADKDGNLNESAVGEFMSGGFDVSRTVQLDHQRLGAVGRANFIRNEGRLRGAVLERFGGNVNAMALMGWASGKGLDINEMDDRSMLFAQRQLGMGRDEFSAALSMAQRLPDIMREQRNSKDNDGFLRQLGDENRQKGVEGLKTKFKQAREQLNGKLQSIGQEFFNEGSDMIERFVNEMTGQYVQSMSKDADSAFRSRSFGGAYGKAQFQRVFGKIGGAPGGFGGAQDSGFAAFHSGFFGTSTADRFKGAGYNVDALGVGSSPEARYQSGLARVRDIQSGMGNISGNVAGLGATASGTVLDIFSNSSGKGADLLSDFGKRLSDAADRDPAAKALLDQWRQASTDGQRASIMKSAAVGAGVSIDNRMAAPGFSGGTGGTFRSQMQKDLAFGESILGRRADHVGNVFGNLAKGAAGGAAVGAGIGALFGGVGAAPGAVLGAGIGAAGAALAHVFGSTDDQKYARSLGSYAGTEEFRDLAKDLFGGSAGDRKATMEMIDRKIIGLQDSGGDKGQIDALKALKLTQRATDLLSKRGGDEGISEEEWARVVKDIGLEVPSGTSARMFVRQMGGTISRSVNHNIQESNNLYAKKIRSVAERNMQTMKSLGIASVDKNGTLVIGGEKANVEGLSKLNSQQMKALQLLVKTTGKATMATGDEDSLNRVGATAEHYQNALTDMSVAEKRAWAEQLSGLGLGSEAGNVLDRASLQDRFTKQSKKKGVGAALGDQLGIKFSGDLSSDTGRNKFLSALEQQLGPLQDSGAVKEQIASIVAGQKSGKDVSGMIRGLQSGQIGELMKAKREKDQEAENPLMAKIKDANEKMVEHLDSIAKSTRSSSGLLDTIAKVASGDPEAVKNALGGN